MAITVEERFESGEINIGDNSTELKRYIIRGTDDNLAAVTALAAYAPAVLHGLVKKNISLPVSLGVELWEGEVLYGLAQIRPLEGAPVYRFDTTGGTRHVIHSLQTLGRYAPPGGTAPDYGGLIGVTKDSVEGVDVPSPRFVFEESHSLGSVTNAYKRNLADLTGKVNDYWFKDWAAGEVMFLGASGTKRGYEMWELTFRFAVIPNVVNQSVGDIVGIDKKGHDYLWVRYAEAEDGTAKAVVKIPIAAYVERVCESGDFSQLLI